MKLTNFFTAFDTKITFSPVLLSADRHREITALSFKMKDIAPLTRFGWESGNFLRCVSASYQSVRISNFSFFGVKIG